MNVPGVTVARPPPKGLNLPVWEASRRCRGSHSNAKGVACVNLWVKACKEQQGAKVCGKRGARKIRTILKLKEGVRCAAGAEG